MIGPDTVAERLAALREEFDGSFGQPVRPPDAEHAELLTLRAGGRRYALRLAQTSGLHPDRSVTPLPGPLPALLGLAGFGGTIVPVFDLAALLGHPAPDRPPAGRPAPDRTATGPAAPDRPAAGRAALDRPRWLVLAAGAPPLALGFTELDGHVRVPVTAIVTDGHAGPDGVRGMVMLPGGTRPLVDVPATRALVHRLTGHTIAPGHPR
jgi:hypothetical protein